MDQQQQIFIVVCLNLAGIIMNGLVQVYALIQKKSFKSSCCEGRCCLLEKETQMRVEGTQRKVEE